MFEILGRNRTGKMGECQWQSICCSVYGTVCMHVYMYVYMYVSYVDEMIVDRIEQSMKRQYGKIACVYGF